MGPPIVEKVIDIAEPIVIPGYKLYRSDKHYRLVGGNRSAAPSGAVNRWCHDVAALLWRAGDGETPGTGRYDVYATVPVMAVLFGGLGPDKSITELDGLDKENWPCKDYLGNCCIPSKLAHCNMGDGRPAKRIAPIEEQLAEVKAVR